LCCIAGAEMIDFFHDAKNVFTKLYWQET